MTGRFRHILAVCVVLSAFAAALVAVSLASAANQPVAVEGFKFPDSLTVKAGDTVTWTNSDRAPHTVTANDGSFDKSLAASGGTAAVTFAATGTFAYHCNVHPTMTGTIVVQAASSGGSTTSAPAASGTVAAPATGSGTYSGGGTPSPLFVLFDGLLAAMGLGAFVLALQAKARR